MQRLLTNHDEEKKATHEKSVKYVSYKEICPGQLRYSSQNKAEKIAKLKKKEAAIWNEDKKNWEYKHHHGTSLFSKKDALPVLHTNFGYVLIDGHHDLVSSLELKAEMIPIKIVADLRHLSQEEFWKFAEEQGWVYLHKMNGEKGLPPKTFDKLVDDANRYFAAITARKYYNENGACTSKGAEYPLWIKIGKDIPFIEFKIANALFSKGFAYNAEQMGNPPKSEFIELARKILIEANLPGLCVVPTPTHFEKIKIDGKSITISNEIEKRTDCRLGA